MSDQIVSPTVRDMLDAMAARLLPWSDTPELDAQVLLAHVMGKTRSWLLAHPTASLDPQQSAVLDDLRQKLEHGTPLPYVLGHWEFFGLDFDLTPDVLIPRPETELLVERAIAWLQRTPGHHIVADIGTGSGCIAVAIAVHLPQVRLLATDISLAALKVARHNARKHGVAERIDFLQCDLLPPCPNHLPSGLRFDLLCANLPYIPTQELHNLPIYGREPTLALDGGPDGLEPFRRVLRLAPRWLTPGGMMLLEIESTKSLKVLSLAYDALETAVIRLKQDAAGRERLLEIQLQ